MKSLALMITLQATILPLPKYEFIPNTEMKEELQSNAFQVVLENHVINQKLGLQEKKDIQIIKDETIVDPQILVDGQILELEWENNQTTISISPSNHQIQLIGTNEQEVQVKRVIEIEIVEKPIVQVNSNQEYRLDTTLPLVLEQAQDYDLCIHNKSTSTSWLKRNEEIKDFQLSQEGQYSISLQHRNYPYIQFEIDHFFFTTQSPTGTIEFEKHSSNEVKSKFAVQSSWVKETKIYILSETGQEVFPFAEEMMLPIEKGKDQIFLVSLQIEDLFGQEAWIEKEIRIDDCAPSMELIVNGEKMVQKSQSFDFIEKIEVNYSEKVSVEKEIYINDSRTDLQDEISAFQTLPNGFDLKVVYRYSDEAGNQSTDTYIFHKNQPIIPSVLPSIVQPKVLEEPMPLLETPLLEAAIKEEKKEEEVIPTITTKNISLSDYQIQERVYSMNDNHEIVFEEKLINKKVNPSITVHVLQTKNNKAKILVKGKNNGLKNKVVWIKVNGKKIKLSKPKKDSMGNMVYEISLKGNKNQIEIKVKNEKGYTKRIQKTIVSTPVQKENQSWWDSIVKWFDQMKQIVFYD